MIPLKDNIPRERWPIVVRTLIVIMMVVFLYEMILSHRGENGEELAAFFQTWGLVPREFMQGIPRKAFLELVTPLTSIFVHAGLPHAVGNLLYLWIFGASVEGELGRLRFFSFFLICGMASGAIHVASASDSFVATVGASGAISGVLGAYLLFYPLGKLRLLLVPVPVPALIFLVLWFGIQVMSGLEAFTNDETLGVAWWSHIGGFLAGISLAGAMRPERSPQVKRRRGRSGEKSFIGRRGR